MTLGDKKADLAGPGIGNYEDLEKVLPNDYKSALSRAETTATVANLVAPRPAPDLGVAWRGLMFNSFHDILPGSSIERALDEQTDWTRGLLHTARAAEFDAVSHRPPPRGGARRRPP